MLNNGKNRCAGFGKLVYKTAVSFHILLIFAVATLAVSSCANIDNRKAMTDWKLANTSGLEKTASLSGSAIPVLAIIDPGPGFKNPVVVQSPSGSYDIRQTGRFPQGNVEVGVIGSPLPAPQVNAPPTVLEPGPGGTLIEELRTWRTVSAPAIGKEIRYYLISKAQGGTEETWETEIFTHTSPDGKTGSYQAICAGAEEKSAPQYFAKIGALKN